ncbi:MAG: iron-sulfur cluster repair di-iron protein [Saprospirales bacterium]|nr:MAG: iron-sulfur cluster repair di-iron protein [Saprospirales bacterium]
MKITEKSIIGELVAENYQTAKTFKKYKVDFCCQGSRTIEDACAKKKIDPAIMVEELNEVVAEKRSEVIDFKSWPMDLLIDYIEKKHHRYVEEQIAIIMPYLQKVVKVHGQHNPELIEIHELFAEAATELTSHMKKEELILFPYIKKLEAAKRARATVEPPQFITVENSIRMMMHEHDTEGERFRKISELSDTYTPPMHACNTYRVSFALLKEFEEDLHMHIHLENNILFPKAAQLEKQFQHQPTVQ